MNMKKSAIAIAVTGAVAAPMSASAAEVYGRIDIGLESATDPTSAFIFPGFNSNRNATSSPELDEHDFQLQNGNQSRIGFTDSEDLGGGWSVTGKIELEMNILSDNNNGPADDPDSGAVGETRLGWVQFANGPHSVTIGKQWQPAYEYMGWNQGRMPTHGYASYFKTMSYMLDAGTVSAGSSGATGYRQDSSIGYQFGGGGYSTDPFTVDVLLGVNNGGEQAANFGANNEAGISSIQVFAAGTFGPDITINGGVIQDFRDLNDTALANSGNAGADEVEPSLFTIGGRFPIGDSGFEIGTSLYRVDTDIPQGDEEVDTAALTGFWTGPNGWSAQLGFATVDADEDTARSDRIGGFNFGASQTEVDSWHFGVTKALSSRTSLRLVGEWADVDQTVDSSGTVGDSDIDGGVVMLGVQHNF